MPRAAPKENPHKPGLILVHTGEGKGKSSSAFGVVFRAAGWGKRVCVIQFIKGKWQTGEEHAASRFENIDWHALGDGFTWDTQNPEKDRHTSREIWAFSQAIMRSGEYDLVVLDEINYCCGYGWISGQEIAEFLEQEKPHAMHVILTGRNAPAALIEVAHTVTEMGMLKHAYKQGIQAAKGIEF
ncbi:cob(I)yrinic acid a,c-diamide adenosyltransferase [Magnetococcus marinus]|uniref:cob(I)yrinic acid a,c-diamide adenosyltransferase n=1 Tax=Magnetococcus marinus TaxID=1124597 RepID=UPI0005A10D8A